ncbi:MAG: hypothetical protein K2Y21_00775 [Phycisphaerales bacterium]|nr:hypothetical protein [Phycisphaerales bacterium]
MFVGSTTGGSAAQAIFRHNAGSTSALFARGAAAPGTGGTLQNFSNVAVNASGNVAFIATVNGGTSSGAIYKSGPGATLSPVALAGTAAPGGETYNGFSAQPSFNKFGHTLFQANMLGGTSRIFRSDAGGTSLVFSDSTSFPTFGNASSFGNAVINDAGTIAVNASFAAGSANFVVRGSTITTLAATGGTIDGLGGVTIASVSSPLLNNFGVAVFRVTLAGAGVTTTNDTAYVFGTQADNLKVLVREGDTINIGGIMQTLTGNLSSINLALSDGGVSWRATYATGSAIMYSTDPGLLVPGPGIALGGIAFGLITAARRRRA